MRQYLLSVPMIEDAPAASDAERSDRRTSRSAELNAEMQAAGTWVFGGGLLPASSATVVRAQGGEVLDDRRTVHRVQGAHRRVLGH